MDERMQKVLESIKASPKEVRLLPVDERVLAECRERLTLNWGSLLGVLLENTGGIVIDGWLRFYGAMRGSPFIPSSSPKRTASGAGRAERCP